MVNIPSKAIPFVVILIATAMIGIDTFTDYEITEESIEIIIMVLTPLGLGGLVNKGFNVYKSIKEKAIDKKSSA